MLAAPSYDLTLPMELHQLEQGSEVWLSFRRTRRPASLAAVMLGCSPFMTRTELLDAYTTGLWPEPTEFQAEIFAKGHFVEKCYRPRAEEFIAQALYPIVVSRGVLSASFDGFWEDERGNWECKQLNQELAAALPHAGWEGCERNTALALPKMYRVQMEQQCMCGGVDRVLFTAADFDADGNLRDERLCWYESDPDLAAEIIAGWKQFDADLITHKPIPKVVKVRAEEVEALPALLSTVSGTLVVTHNFKEAGAKVRAYVASLPKEPKTDQDFANIADAVKRLDEFEKALDREENRALSHLQPINDMRTEKAALQKFSRDNRLAFNTLHEAKKKALRTEILLEHQQAFDTWVRQQNEAIGLPLLSTAAGTIQDARIADGMSGKKSINGWREGAAQAVAEAKIKVSAIVDRVKANQAAYKELVVEEHRVLFADYQQLLLKDPEVFRILCGSRISDHKAREEKRLEQEREKLRAEVKAEVQAAPAPALSAGQAQHGTVDGLASGAPRLYADEPTPARTASAASEFDYSRAGRSSGGWLSSGAPVGPGQVRNDLADPFAAPAAPARRQLEALPPPATSGEGTLTITALNARLKYTVTAAFLESLGVVPVDSGGNAKRYREADYPRILIAIRNHNLQLLLAATEPSLV